MREKQNERVLNRLKQGPLTSLQAIEELGIMRLGARVWELREDGHTIMSKTVVIKNRFDEDCHIAEYSLLEAKQDQDTAHQELTA